MSVTISRGSADTTIDEIAKVLNAYELDHPRARIDLYRQNAVSVRIRIIDPEFSGKGKSLRSQLVWTYLDRLSDDVQSDISTLLLLAPDETNQSFANVEFEDPVSSAI